MPEYLIRSAWGAKHGPNAAVPTPHSEVIVHTAAGSIRSPGASLEMDSQAMRNIEHFHYATRGWKGGVGYTFVIMRSGRIFEGQGWGHKGTHTESRNHQVAICFDGHGDQFPATPQQWESAEWLIREGVRIGKLVANYRVSGHRDYSTKGKTCPGNLIYPEIQRLAGLVPVPPTTPTPEEPDMTPEQSRQLDETHRGQVELNRRLSVLESKLDNLARGGHYEGHEVPEGGLIDTIGQLAPKGPGSRSIRTMTEMIWNALYTSDGKMKSVIARVLGGE